MLADEVDYVIGVDTHRDQHTLAVVVAPTGAALAQTVVVANTRGYSVALRFADKHAPGARAWAVEGAGHYGAGLTRYLAERGETVLEVGRPTRSERRLRGKDDPLDAIRAARAGLAAETLTLPRSGQRQEALRVLLLARRSAVDVRRVALVQLRSVIVTAPDRLRDELRGLSVSQLIKRCSRFRRSQSRSADELAIVLALAHSHDASRPQRPKRTSSSARYSATSARSRRSSSTNRASVRSSPRNSSSAGHTATASGQKLPSHASPASPRYQPRAAQRSGTASTAA